MSSLLIHRATALEAQARNVFRPVAPLLTRLVLGHAFLLTGMGKLGHLSQTTDFFTRIGLPLPGFHAVFIGCLELVGGACLILGLGTRAVALLLASTMIVALATADRASLMHAFFLRGQPGFLDITALTFLLFLGWLFVAGAGVLSVDEWWGRKRRCERA
jgi:putative oxidoreductase